MKNKKNKIILIGADLFFVALSFLLSTIWSQQSWGAFEATFALFLAVKFSLIVYFGLYRAILRFAGLPLAASIIKATSLSSIALLLLLKLPPFGPRFLHNDFPGGPQSIPSPLFVGI